MTLNLGLRFDPRDADRLDAIADRMRSEGVDVEHITLFAAAAEDARKGEPLIVVCTEPSDAHEMAAAFVLWGIQRPVVAELSGSA